jgi:tRNA(fMet)-specific endonuclease VapC
LLFGAMNSAQAASNQQRVEQLASSCRLLAPTRDTARRYAEIRLALKTKGRPIPINDLWIAAIAVEHGLPLATEDAHFLEVDTLQRVAMSP